jgi:hypothetical protein
MVLMHITGRLPQEALNHLSVSNKMAETALDVISRRRVTSRSSSVGGGARGCSRADQIKNYDQCSWAWIRDVRTRCNARRED